MPKNDMPLEKRVYQMNPIWNVLHLAPAGSCIKYTLELHDRFYHGDKLHCSDGFRYMAYAAFDFTKGMALTYALQQLLTN